MTHQLSTKKAVSGRPLGFTQEVAAPNEILN